MTKTTKYHYLKIENTEGENGNVVSGKIEVVDELDQKWKK